MQAIRWTNRVLAVAVVALWAAVVAAWPGEPEPASAAVASANPAPLAYCMAWNVGYAVPCREAGREHSI